MTTTTITARRAGRTGQPPGVRSGGRWAAGPGGVTGHDRACRCTGCVAARRVYQKAWALDVLRHGPRLVPAGPTRVRLAQLLGSWSAAHVAHLTGFDDATLRKVAGGEYQRCLRTLADAVAACRPHPGNAPSAKTLVPALGAVRRVEALYALGYRSSDIEALTGLGSLRRMLTHIRVHGRVQAGTWLAIDRAYIGVHGQPGTSAVTAARAARAGYATPAGWDWDDVDIDDPAARPRRVPVRAGRYRASGGADELTVDAVLAGYRMTLTAAERAEAVRRMTAAGRTTRECADRLGLTARTVERYRAHLADEGGVAA